MEDRYTQVVAEGADQGTMAVTIMH